MTHASSRLDRYYDGLGDAEERARFETELAASPAVRAELTLQRELDARLRAHFGPSLGTGLVAARRPRRLFALAAAASLAALGFAAWRAFTPSTTPPPAGAETWCAWVEDAHTRTPPDDLVGCAILPPDAPDPNAPVGPVALGEGLFLPMGWRSDLLAIAAPEGTHVYRVTSREGRAAVVLIREATEPAMDIAPEPRLAATRRVVGELEVVELVLDGEPFVLGAISGR